MISKAVRRVGTGLLALAAGGVAATALAAPASATWVHDLKPSVSCYTHANGGYEVYFGYTNGEKNDVSIPVNVLTNFVVANDGKLSNGVQPTTFKPGKQDAVFAVKVKENKLVPEAIWKLNGQAAIFESSSLSKYSECKGGVELPGTGNALAVAGLVAGVAVIGGTAITVASRRAKD